jgi:xylulokinase
MSGDPRAVLGIDVGTTNTKVVVLGIGSGEVSPLFVRVAPTPEHPGELLDSVCRLVRAATSEVTARIEAVGVASMAETGVLLGDDDVPLGALVRWNSGSAAAGNRFAASLGLPQLYRATGVPAPHKTPLAAWHRLRETDSARWSATRRWSGVADFVVLQLTGALVTDHTLAARTMAFRLPEPHQELPTEFDADLLDAVGMLPHRLPAVAAAGEQAGAVSATAASVTGLAAGTPVYVAGHDHAVGAWAAGVRESGHVANSIGTAETLLRITDGTVDREAARLAGMSIGRTVTGPEETLLAGNPTGGALVDWVFVNLLPGVERARTFARLGRREAAASGLLVLPYLRGRQSPLPDPDAQFTILDRSGAPMTDPIEPEQLLAAVLEGLVLHLRWMLEAQQSAASAGAAEAITVVGGPGAANDAWWRLKTAILPATLDRVTASEPVAAGAALLAGVRSELAGPDACLPRVRSVEIPNGGFDPAFTDFVAAATTTVASTRDAATSEEQS